LGDDFDEAHDGKGLRRSTARWGKLAAACARTRAHASTWLCLRCVRPSRRGAQEEHRWRVHGGSWVHSGDSRDIRTLGQCAEATWPAQSRRARRARRGDDVARHKFISFKPLQNCKNPKIVNKLENLQKNKSCRGAIDLQLFQRVTYVLINGLFGNVGRSCRFSTARVTVHSAVNSIFGQFALKIGMSANYKKCVPENNEQLSYWPILNFYSEIWRTRKKTESAFLRSRVLTTIWDFDQGLLCKCVLNHVKHV
jgi:hypothetical protein